MIRACAPLSDIQVTCTFAQDCLLPCTFEPASSVNVSWQQQDVPFLTFRLGADPEELLLPSYADRASLFAEQVSHGNASLQIKQTSPQDRGRYRCTVSTDRAVEDTIVIVRVEGGSQGKPYYGRLETTRSSVSNYQVHKHSMDNNLAQKICTIYTTNI